MQGAGSKVQGAEFRVQGSGCRIQGSGSRVEGRGSRVQRSGFRLAHRGERRSSLLQTPHIRLGLRVQGIYVYMYIYESRVYTYEYTPGVQGPGFICMYVCIYTGPGCRVQGSGFRVQGLGFRVAHRSERRSSLLQPPLRVYTYPFIYTSPGCIYTSPRLGFRVQGLYVCMYIYGCRVQGAGCRVQGSGLRVRGSSPLQPPPIAAPPL